MAFGFFKYPTCPLIFYLVWVTGLAIILLSAKVIFFMFEKFSFPAGE